MTVSSRLPVQLDFLPLRAFVLFNSLSFCLPPPLFSVCAGVNMNTRPYGMFHVCSGSQPMTITHCGSCLCDAAFQRKKKCCNAPLEHRLVDDDDSWNVSLARLQHSNGPSSPAAATYLDDNARDVLITAKTVDPRLKSGLNFTK